MTNWSEAQHPRDDRGKFEDAGIAQGDRRVAVSPSAAPAPHVSEVAAGDQSADGEEWWDGAPAPPGDFWAEPEPDTEGMSPAFAAMVRQNPSLADGYEELKALRDAGYEGPVDQDGKPA